MNVIPFEYQGQPVRFSVEGWINATEIAKRHGKHLRHWFENEETKRYIESLARHLNIRDSGYLIQAKRGRGGGTWLHPKLAVAFARWIDVDFGVWADMQIDAIMRSDVSAMEKYVEATKALESRKELASAQGRGLSQWRREKEPLQRRAEYWRDQLQMSLPLH